MKDYVECMRLIAFYNYVLFDSDTGSSIRGPCQKQALSSHFVTNEVVDKKNTLSSIYIPPKVYDIVIE